MNKLFLVIFLFINTLSFYAQSLSNPKLINTKGDYLHKPTKTYFPESLERGFKLKYIYAFDKKKENIGVTYFTGIDSLQTTFSLYIYPAGDGSEERLIREYQNSLESISNIITDTIHLTQFPVKYAGEKYDCNGIKAEYRNIKNEYSILSLYEAGSWFLKLRLSTQINDRIIISELEESILNFFDPSHLILHKGLKEKANVYFDKFAFQDSILLGSAMGSAFKKISWAKENLSPRERASGFSSHYLEMQIAAFKEFLEFDKKYNYKKTEFTKNYLLELKSLIDSGYLDEFLMEHFNYIMIVPDEHNFEFNEYDKWKKENKIRIDLQNQFYIIAYEQK